MRRWGGLVIDRQSREFIIEKVKHYYNLFQFLTPAEVEIDGKRIKTKPNACILSAPMQPRWLHFPCRAVMNWTHQKKDVLPLIEGYNIPLNCVFYPDNPEEISAVFRQNTRKFNSGNDAGISAYCYGKATFFAAACGCADRVMTPGLAGLFLFTCKGSVVNHIFGKIQFFGRLLDGILATHATVG